MIKLLIDALRDQEGYAGMAVYRGDGLLFCDGLETGLADKMKRLFDDNKAIVRADSMIAVVRGYTINVYMADDILIVCRSEGRFTPVPRPGEEELSFSTGQQASYLITREEAKKEAGLMLKRLMNKD
jgi:hypothetical protein